METNGSPSVSNSKKHTNGVAEVAEEPAKEASEAKPVASPNGRDLYPRALRRVVGIGPRERNIDRGDSWWSLRPGEALLWMLGGGIAFDDDLGAAMMQLADDMEALALAFAEGKLDDGETSEDGWRGRIASMVTRARTISSLHHNTLGMMQLGNCDALRPIKDESDEVTS